MDRLHLFEGNMTATQRGQQCKLRRFEGVMSNQILAQVLEEGQMTAPDCGSLCRDIRGKRCPRREAVWKTDYLHTNYSYKNSPVLQDFVGQLVQLAFKADLEGEWGLLEGKEFGKDVFIRNIELHTYEINGRLPQKHHNDTGSLVTVDAMLNDSFKGGEFLTLEGDGTLEQHVFCKGDVCAFPSHKYHCVNPILSGTRHVMVIELWSGPERQCGHRCSQGEGECTHTFYPDS
mmetsp:Transcript_22939/g.36553  ORF Transcript_22939/g.36553 Transcript_22939/m.36553 type:complete len:232 (-) Transcript_22939:1176-1871(-)